jgi:hypothetical protein
VPERLVATLLRDWHAAIRDLEGLPPDAPADVRADAQARCAALETAYREASRALRELYAAFPGEMGKGRLYQISDADLAAARDDAGEAVGSLEDAELEAAMFESEEDSHDRGDTQGRLEAWRDAEREWGASDTASDAGHDLRQRADDARDAFHEAEDAQRERHGEPRRSRPS